MSTNIAATSKIYKVVNPDGSITYTDKPVPGATEFKFISKPNVVAPAPTTTTPPAARQFIDNKGQSTKPAAAINYDLQVRSPAHEETIRSNEGKVNITASLSPSGAGTFELYLNGALHQKNTTPQFSLINLDRGEYKIQIRFLDQTGKLLASSPLSTFYLQKVSALLRAN